MKIQKSRPLRHAIEIRHKSFMTEEFVDLLRRTKVALVVADTAKQWPYMEDMTADFVYARLQRTSEEEKSGYPARALALWAKRARQWGAGGAPDDLAALVAPPASGKRDVFIYMISGAKARAPAAAMALIDRLKGD